MIYVQFHYRLATDREPTLQGAWKEFSNDKDAAKWVIPRMNKTPCSPQGEVVFKFANLNAVPTDYNNWYCYNLCAISLQKAIQSYVQYCNRKKQKQNV